MTNESMKTIECMETKCKIKCPLSLEIFLRETFHLITNGMTLRLLARLRTDMTSSTFLIQVLINYMIYILKLI